MTSSREKRAATSASPLHGVGPAPEEFLFHLHRGSELLLEGREDDARQELEKALGVHPRDAHAEDLLGITYFRLGMYERALEIYERLVRENPAVASLQINLALVHLKTGQLTSARTALVRALELAPDHARGHGYLGLVLSRLGEYRAAQEAFERGEQPAMARRMERLLQSAAGRAEVPPDQLAREEVRRRDLKRVAESAFRELEGAENPFQLEDSGAHVASDGAWQRVGPATPERRAAAPAPAVAGPPTTDGLHPVGWGAARASGVPPDPVGWGAAPPRLGTRIREAALAFPEDDTFAIDTDGRLRVRIEGAVHCRLRGVIAMVGDLDVQSGRRKTRGQVSVELLGPADAPLSRLRGEGGLVVDPGPQRFEAFLLEDEVAYVREDALVAIDGNLVWENGRLPAGQISIPLVNLRGRGSFVIATRAPWSSLDVRGGRIATVALRTILGWTGRLLPHAGPAPPVDGTPDLIQFRGDGVLLLRGQDRT